MNEVKEKEYDNQTFEDIKHIDENGIEYWYARELMPILQYTKWQNFKKIIDKAMVQCENCKNSGMSTLIYLNKAHYAALSKPLINAIEKRPAKYIEAEYEHTQILMSL